MRLTGEEKQSYERDGFLVRKDAFTSAEVGELRQATEELCRELAVSEGPRRKIVVSEDYVFEPDANRGIFIKWEPGQDVIQGLEPFAHLHPVFTRYLMHSAFVEPLKDIVGTDDIGVFTEKLNVKRAEVGGKYALHQDYPYWRTVADDAERMATAMLALDEATVENGALEVLPGSHKLGMVPGKKSEKSFEENEIDPAVFDTSAMVHVEVPAGAVIFFGPYMVHRSAPNRSGKDRRALLYTYQKAGGRTQLENLREYLSRRR